MTVPEPVKADAKNEETTPASETAEKREPSNEQMREAARKQLNVDETYKKTVTEMKEVTEKFSGTRAAFEALVSISNLYLNHQETAKALPWLEKATQAAPSSFEKSLALYSLAVAQEDQNQCDTAVKTFDEILNLGVESIKGEALLGKARCHTVLGQKDEAIKSYERVQKELKDTSFSKKADTKIAELKS